MKIYDGIMFGKQIYGNNDLWKTLQKVRFKVTLPHLLRSPIRPLTSTSPSRKSPGTTVQGPLAMDCVVSLSQSLSTGKGIVQAYPDDVVIWHPHTQQPPSQSGWPPSILIHTTTSVAILPVAVSILVDQHVIQNKAPPCLTLLWWLWGRARDLCWRTTHYILKAPTSNKKWYRLVRLALELATKYLWIWAASGFLSRNEWLLSIVGRACNLGRRWVESAAPCGDGFFRAAWWLTRLVQFNLFGAH